MKNHAIKMCYSLILMAVIAVYLVGCTSKDVTPATTPTAQESHSFAANSEPTVLNSTELPETTATTEPMHFEETISDDFRVDAQVLNYPADGMAGIYTATPKTFTKEEIQALVSFCGNSIVSNEEWDDGNMINYQGECEKGYTIYHLWMPDGINTHPYSEFNYYNFQTYKTYLDYLIYTDEEAYLYNKKYTTGWMFTEPKDFSFATSQEAEEEVRKALDTLGLHDLALLRTLYVDHDTMAETGELLATDESFAPIGGEAQENNGFILRDDWSEKDDAYVFSFGIPVSGIPMSYRFEEGDTATYCGTSIVVWYTQSGILSLWVSTPWTVEDEETPPAPIISPQVALDAAKEKYIYDLAKKDKCIEEIRLEYHYFRDRDRWLLKPVWAVATSFAVEGVDDRYYDHMNIDALTGMEL